MSISYRRAPNCLLPSRRLVDEINEAALILYGRWRGIGWSHDRALGKAASFARRVARVSSGSRGSTSGPAPGFVGDHPVFAGDNPARVAISVIIADAMVAA